MIQIEFRFEIGQKVVHFTGVHGTVTAMYHRSGRNSYEMSLCDSDGILITKNVEECELFAHDSSSLGFEKN